MIFWEVFYNLCESNNKTPNAVCKELNLSNATATHWKNGTIPKGDVLSNIANYFNVSTDYLLGRTNYPNAIVKTTGYVMKENTIENNSNNGNNIINNSSVSSETDEMTNELIKRFKNLSFDEKIEVFNYIKNLD